MFGDYEAQRHWMELTLALPPTAWYEQGAGNDLQYWGLDYPPLTAYHSALCGAAVALADARAVAFGSESHGYESEASRAAMRATVLASDVLCYLPAALAAAAAYYNSAQQSGGGGRPRDRAGAAYAFAALALQPSLLLIDHGHFQYNGGACARCAAAKPEFVLDFLAQPGTCFRAVVQFHADNSPFAPLADY